MTTDATPLWALPLLFAGQAQKELFHNEALTRIDMLLHAVVASADVASPPASPDIGQCWIVAADGEDEWAGRDDALACWTDGGWRFVAGRIGLMAHVIDRGNAMWHDGTSWQNTAFRADGLYVSGNRVVGARGSAIITPAGGSVIDGEARTAVASILAVLRAHGLIAI
ncbi:MAG: DUF2793 domain-containing protein [Sphingobium sp.]